MAFDPDAYLAGSGGFDPDAYLKGQSQVEKRQTEQKAEPSFVEKAAKFAGESASLPFRGLRGIGVGLQKLNEGPSNALQSAADAMKPGYIPKYGERSGAFAGTVAPLLLFGPTAGAFVGGLAHGTESLAEGKGIGPSGMDAAITTGVGLVANKAVEGIGKGLEFGGRTLSSYYRQLISRAKGINRNVVDSVMETASDSIPSVKEAASQFFDSISKHQKTLTENLTKAQNTNIGGSTTQEIADKALALSKQLRAAGSEISENASKLLSNEPTIQANTLLTPIENLKKTLEIEGKTPGQASGQALSALNRWKKAIEDIAGETTTKLSVGKDKLLESKSVTTIKDISEQNLKKLIRHIDDDTIWDGPADEPIKRVLRQLRNAYDGILKTGAGKEEYKKAMEAASRQMKLSEALEDGLALSRGPNKEIIPTDQTVSRVKSLLLGNRPETEKAVSGIGLKDAIASGRSRIEQGKAKGEAVKSAQKALNVKIPGELAIRQLAETAARQGAGSISFSKLVNIFKAMPAGDASEMARNTVTSAAKDIFERSRGSTLGGSWTGAIANPLIHDTPISKLKWFESIIKNALVKSGKAVGRASKVGPFLYGSEKQ